MTALAMQDGALLMCDGALSTECCELPPGLEACCFPDGTCADLMADDCVAAGGIPQGSGIVCHDLICPECDRLSRQQVLDLGCQLEYTVQFTIVFENDLCNAINGSIAIALTSQVFPAKWAGSGTIQCQDGLGPLNVVMGPLLNFPEGDGWFIGFDMTLTENCPRPCISDFNYRSVSNPCACPPLGAFPIFGTSDGGLDIDATIVELLP